MFVKTIRTLLSLFGTLQSSSERTLQNFSEPSDPFGTLHHLLSALKGTLVQPDWPRGWFQPNAGTAPSLHR